MSKINIETLTPIHIGSGTFLQKGNDFVCGKSEDGYDVIAIINLKKALELIGEDNISSWEAGIKNGRSIDDIIHQYAPQAKLEDFADRIIMRWSNKSTETLKEFIHDGMGRPYIPGSSIKGAIRTAILTSIIDTVPQKEEKIVKQRKTRNGEMKKAVSANEVEAWAFGKDPNNDVFRFLQVGDAIFGKEYEAATRLVNLNERERQSYWDESKPQLVEALVDGDTAQFELKICNDLKSIQSSISSKMPSCMKDIETLFATINTHTLSLLEKEIDYWKERVGDDNAKNVKIYLEKLSELKSKAAECESKKGTCVIRLGHGSGWRFITGAWAEQLSNFNLVIQHSRPRNKNYEEFDFPKSRRVDDECELLGFALLSVDT